MGRRISPLLLQELANLDDVGSCHSPMKSLKSYVRELDSKAIPHFPAEVSEVKEPGSSPGECTISRYELLARVDGPKIVPQIDSIMSTIMRTLSSSAGSFPLYQACSRVVPAIARYAIEPSTPGEEKTRIIQSLYKPLSDALMGLQESVSSGAALCLKAVVQADNWRFASDAMVNEICLKVASALGEKATQTNYHMGLVTILVKRNTMIADAYARSFLRSGLGILSTGITESNTQKRLSAIKMINSLLHCVDSRSIYSELDKVFDAMAKCRTDQFQCVRVAAWETLQIAKAIASQKDFDRRNGKSTPGATESYLVRHMNDGQTEVFAGFGHSRAASEGQRSNTSSPLQRPHSQRTIIDGLKICSTPRKFVRSLQEPTYPNSRDSIRRSPALDEVEQNTNVATYGLSRAASEGRRSNTSSPLQRPQSQLTIDGVKRCSPPRKFVRSLAEPTYSNSRDSVCSSLAFDEVEQNTNVAKYGQCRAASKGRRSNTSSPRPQRPQSQLTIDGVKRCSTRRKLSRLLQEPTYSNSRDSVCRSLAFDEVEQSTKVATYGTAYPHNLMSDVNARRNIEKMGMRNTENSSESVSSTYGTAYTHNLMSDVDARSIEKMGIGHTDDSEVTLGSSESVTSPWRVSCRACEERNSQKRSWRVLLRNTLIIAVPLLAAIVSFMRMDDEEFYLIPT